MDDHSSISCVLLVTMLLTTTSVVSAAGVTMRAELTHVDSGRGFTRWELLNRMAARSRARAASFHHRHHRGGGNSYYGHPATAPVAPGTVGDSSTEYLIHFGIGTPHPQPVALTLDTGSDLVWTQCEACVVCFDQPLPKFNPSASNTIHPVQCSDPACAGSDVAACDVGNQRRCFYLYSYGDKSITAGTIFRDTVTFNAPNCTAASGGGGTVVVPNVTGVFNTNESGIAGFGRGPQSLPSQLKVGNFSHCFTSMLDQSAGKRSPVFLGTPDDLSAHATGPVRSTPMPRPQRRGNNFYYLLLRGITVGATRLPIDESAFSVKGDGTGTGGTIIDSGTAVTSFPRAVYDYLATAFKKQMHLPVAVKASKDSGLLCFDGSAAAAEKKKVSYVPKLVFHLEGADMDLPRENYMFLDAESEVMCLMIDRSLEGDTTIIGNFQQQNMHIVYDVENSKLLFAPAQCDSEPNLKRETA